MSIKTENRNHLAGMFVALSFQLLIASCGNGKLETVTADSSVTSASVAASSLPATRNTDTTTAAPVADTADSKPADTTATHPATAEKKNKVLVKPIKKTGKK